MYPTVYVGQLQLSANGFTRQCDDAASSIGMVREVQDARVVFIKPNLTFPTYKQGVTTRVEFVEELVKLLLRINPRLKILIGEGEGGYNSFSMSDAMKAMGFDGIAFRHPNVEVINLSKVPARSEVIGTERGPYAIQLPEVFFKDIDFSIGVPLPKIHCMTTVTLSLKNLWGCLPDVMRLKNHYMFPHIISRIAPLLKFRYAFLDGKFGLDRYGPMDGDAVEVNWFAAANSLGAFDVVVSSMMGFDWRRIAHLQIGHRYGIVPRREDIRVIGDYSSLRRSFRLKRVPWTYPALLAFHSKNLTRFFYLSRHADFLHDVMYTFRKRTI